MVYAMNKVYNTPKCNNAKNITHIDIAVVWAKTMQSVIFPAFYSA